MVRSLLASAVLAALPAVAAAQQPVPARILNAIFGVPPADKEKQGYGAADAAKADRDALKAEKLDPADAKGLLDYFRSRTLSPDAARRIDFVIRRMGADSFDERLKAMAEAEEFGPAAVAPLRRASTVVSATVNTVDYEVAYRAGEVLKRLEKVPQSTVARAAARALAKVPDPATTRVLMAYLPQADDGRTVEAIQATLTALALRDGKPDPYLVECLADESTLKRLHAALALIEGGEGDKSVRVPAAKAQVLAAAKAEKDPDTKFAMNYALAVTARDKDAVTALIPLIPEVSRGRVWQAEDLLLSLAGDAAPKTVFGATRPALAKAAHAWDAWWAKAAATTDLAKVAYTPRVLGRTFLVVLDPRNGGGGGYVTELGVDMKERWKFEDGSNPQDAQMLPDGNVAVAETGSNSISIRDTTGRVLLQKPITGKGGQRIYGNPHQLQVLPNGDFLVACRNMVVEMKRDKDEAKVVYERANHYDITAATRLPNGETAVFLQNGPNQLVFIDAAGKEIEDRKIATGQPYYQADIAVGGPGTVLVTENQQVAEYDIKTRKPVWTHKVNNARSVQRLPSGNTLIVESSSTSDGSNRVVEVTKLGEEVWSHRLPPGLMILRATRR